ncbi:MAG: metal ABC transporter solute-binding protein, Zn/Mn family [Vulcanococcus sp.]
MSPLPRPHRSLPQAVALSAGALTLVSACSQPPAAEVIAADGALCDITRRLAAADVRVQCLLGPNDDPHQFQLTPTQSRDLRLARLVLINGYGLTPPLERQSGAIPIAERAVPKSPKLSSGADPDAHPEADSAHDHDHPQDQTTGPEGHQHGERDPHVWHDPAQAAAMVTAVSQQLQQLRPAAAAAIAQRATAMTQTLRALDRWNRRQFASLPPQPGRRTLATGHRAFASLSRAYGLRELAVVDAHSASDSLRPRALAAAVKRLQQNRVPALFSETWPASRALLRISDLSGVPLAPQALRADGLAPAAGRASSDGDLMATLTANTCLIVDQLGGRCDRRGEQRLISQWQAIR